MEDYLISSVSREEEWLYYMGTLSVVNGPHSMIYYCGFSGTQMDALTKEK